MAVVLRAAAVVVATAAAVLVVEGAGCFRPSVKPVLAPVVAAGAVAAAEMEAETVVAAPKGFSIKDKPPEVVGATGAMLVVIAVGAMGRANPEPRAGAVVAAGAERENRDGAEDRAGCVLAGGAGVVEGLMPRVKLDWVAVAAVEAAGG